MTTRINAIFTTSPTRRRAKVACHRRGYVSEGLSVVSQRSSEQSGMERRGSVSSSLRERSPGEAVLQRKRTTVSETNDLQRSVL